MTTLPGFRGGAIPPLGYKLPEHFVDHLNTVAVAARRQVVAEEKRALKALADYCHTTVTAQVYEHLDGVEFVAGGVVRYLASRSEAYRLELRSLWDVVQYVAPHLRDAWFRYTPEIPPNIVLGED